MLKTGEGPGPTKGRYYLVSADGFLFTGALLLLSWGLLALVFHQPSLWSELLSQVALVGSMVGGTVLAWRLHGNVLKGAWWAVLALGILAGLVVAIPVLFALFTLGRFIPSPFPREAGPWGGILLLTAAVIAFIALPVYKGIRDLAGRRGSIPVAITRLAAFTIIVTVVVITGLIGGEFAEAGIFVVPVSVASASAIAGVMWLQKRRAGRGRSRAHVTSDGA